MFDSSTAPRVFHVPCGVDYPAALIAGLERRMAGAAPQDWAAVTLIVNTRRMERRITELFAQGPARLLPRVHLIDSPDSLLPAAQRPVTRAVSSLRRTLDLTPLLEKLLDQSPDFAGRTTLFDLARSLGDLMDEMHGEGVGITALDALDVSDESGHWQRALAFLRIAASYVHSERDRDALNRRAVEHIIADWDRAPPQHPIIVAGSTGSRGTTRLLMEAVARLPQGAIVLPGFDTDTPAPVWQSLTDAIPEEDHPQYRFAALCEGLGVRAQDVAAWDTAEPAAPARNRLISLALRPAPVTHHWLRDGPGLGDLTEASQGLTLVEAPDQRAEASAIALRMRDAAELGQSVALISPDRTLTRRVSAALDRWDLSADDSAGVPLTLAPPGRLLLQLADLIAAGVSADGLIALLKHPLVCAGTEARGPHMLRTRSLELSFRKKGPPFPTERDLLDWAGDSAPDTLWAKWIARAVLQSANVSDLASRLTDLTDRAERLSAGPDGAESGALYDAAPGRALRAAIDVLADEVTEGDALSAYDFARLLRAQLDAQPVRIQDNAHPDLMIWGTMEARVQGADLVILAGLNEGTWPEGAKPDPWLNRAMRLQAGLLLPERRIGLSAHDFQQAVCGREVWITRSLKSDDAETVPSRWVNRLRNLMQGLPDQGGPQAWAAMQARGQVWLDQAGRLDIGDPVPPSPRPSPAPPVGARPRKLSVTQIKTLIRDPYAIYARKTLRLSPLDPLVQEPDARMRGTVLHTVLEQFVRQTDASDPVEARAALERICDTVLAQEVPWPAARRHWRATLMRAAPWLIESEPGRRAKGAPQHLEVTGALDLPGLDFTLTGTADRIDISPTGRALIYDYKTGAVPTVPQQRSFDRQMMLEAAMAERGAFANLAPHGVETAAFVGLGSDAKQVEAEFDLADDWPKFLAVIETVLSPGFGFTARRAMEKSAYGGDYDHLARYGEWSEADSPTKGAVT
ncbi:MAG: double-strand break repair protein AddB [Pseudomonadota bacterium]